MLQKILFMGIVGIGYFVVSERSGAEEYTNGCTNVGLKNKKGFPGPRKRQSPHRTLRCRQISIRLKMREVHGAGFKVRVAVGNIFIQMPALSIMIH